MLAHRPSKCADLGLEFPSRREYPWTDLEARVTTVMIGSRVRRATPYQYWRIGNSFTWARLVLSQPRHRYVEETSSLVTHSIGCFEEHPMFLCVSSICLRDGFENALLVDKKGISEIKKHIRLRMTTTFPFGTHKSRKANLHTRC